jgi:hypothetical protein
MIRLLVSTAPGKQFSSYTHLLANTKAGKHKGWQTQRLANTKAGKHKGWQTQRWTPVRDRPSAWGRITSEGPPASTDEIVAADYLRAAQAYMLISMPTGTSTIFGAFQAIMALLLETGQTCSKLDELAPHRLNYRARKSSPVKSLAKGLNLCVPIAMQ